MLSTSRSKEGDHGTLLSTPWQRPSPSCRDTAADQQPSLIPNRISLSSAGYFCIRNAIVGPWLLMKAIHVGVDKDAASAQVRVLYVGSTGHSVFLASSFGRGCEGRRSEWMKQGRLPKRTLGACITTPSANVCRTTLPFQQLG